MHKAVAEGNKAGYCDACFTGNYPIEFNADGYSNQKSLFKDFEIEEESRS